MKLHFLSLPHWVCLHVDLLPHMLQPDPPSCPAPIRFYYVSPLITNYLCHATSCFSSHVNATSLVLTVTLCNTKHFFCLLLHLYNDTFPAYIIQTITGLFKSAAIILRRVSFTSSLPIKQVFLEISHVCSKSLQTLVCHLTTAKLCLKLKSVINLLSMQGPLSVTKEAPPGAHRVSLL